MNNNNNGGCLAAILAFVFIAGNAFLFTGALNDDLSDNGIAWLMVIVAVIADLIILGWIASKVFSVVEKKHESNKTEKLSNMKEIVVKEIGNKISHRSEIKRAFDKHFEKIERQSSLVSLISSCMGSNNQELKNLLVSKKDEAFESTKSEILDKLTETEKKRFPQNIAEVEDYEKTLEQEISELKTELNSVAASDDEQISAMIKKHCPEAHKSINRKRIKLIAKIVIPIIIIITLVASVKYIQNAPYRELHSMIEEQSLTAKMLEYNSKNEDSYYDIIHSEKGYEFLASELTELHRRNDAKKAMWLLCIQPNCIDGINLCASDSFIDWVVDYARKNGTQETDSKGNKTYYVDGYKINTSSIFDNPIGHDFSISNGNNGATINRKNMFREEYVPTIQ